MQAPMPMSLRRPAIPAASQRRTSPSATSAQKSWARQHFRRITAHAATPAALPVFKGKVYKRGDRQYPDKRDQYASTSHREDRDKHGNLRMEPMAIIYAKSPSASDPYGADADVFKAIEYARDNKIAIAVRTGGHQYSGASSTSKENLQLDLTDAYPDFKWDDAAGVAIVGVSRKLSRLDEEFAGVNDARANRDKGLDLFVPHGQCAHVHIGGHAHTGGYSMQSRAFGLFADHIVSIRVITADGDGPSGSPRVRWIDRDAKDADDAAMFWATLGGSPGNYGVLTHIKLKPRSGKDHHLARGLKVMVPYTKQRMRELLQVKAAMASDPELPADFDMCITVMSGKMVDLTVGGDRPPSALLAALDTGEQQSKDLRQASGAQPEPLSADDNVAAKYGITLKADIEPMSIAGITDDNERALPRASAAAKARYDQRATIIVWAEWANLDGANQPTAPADAWIAKVKQAANPLFGGQIIHITEQYGPTKSKPGNVTSMLNLTRKWVFPISREFDKPYNKRTYVTSSTQLAQSGWVEATLDRINAGAGQYNSGLRLAIQIQLFGGKASRFRNHDQRTSHSWRADTTVVQVMDCFHADTPAAKAAADKWQQENDQVFKGDKSTFSPGVDRRVLWGSYQSPNAQMDEFDLMQAWRFYHEDEDKFKRLCEVKRHVDPNNIFTPNAFSVRA